jgi:hypothetical protein
MSDAGADRASHRLEISGALVLALCGLASTWCSCDAALWSGQQSSHYAAANELQTRAAHDSTEGAQWAQIDVALFIAWSQAYAAHQQELVDFFEHRFRAEFRPVFEEWLKQQPLKNPNAMPTPFNLPSYTIGVRQRASALAAEADRRTQQGEHANRQSDRFVRGTVLFALALFFAGVVQTFRRPLVKLILQGLSVALLVVGLVVVLYFGARS